MIKNGNRRRLEGATALYLLPHCCCCSLLADTTKVGFGNAEWCFQVFISSSLKYIFSCKIVTFSCCFNLLFHQNLCKKWNVVSMVSMKLEVGCAKGQRNLLARGVPSGWHLFNLSKNCRSIFSTRVLDVKNIWLYYISWVLDVKKHWLYYIWFHPWIL